MQNPAGGRLTYNGFEAWVAIDDKPLPQFSIEYDEAKREYSAWIPSEAGKKFAVHYRKVQRNKFSYRAKLFLDGTSGDSLIHNKHEQNRGGDVKTMSSMEVSTIETVDFMFNSAVLTDEDEYLDHPSCLGIGEIKLILSLAKVARREPPKHRDPGDRKLPEIPKIHERSKKGLVHQIKFSEVKSKPYRAYGKTKLKSIEEPVTFIFRYRSMDVLQANGIAPRPIPPIETNTQLTAETSQHAAAHVKDEDEVDELEDDDDEISVKERELLAALENVRKQKRALRGGSRPAKKVKTEHVSTLIPGEVIDLTEELDSILPFKMKRESARPIISKGVIDLT
ncbi:hypothetical protein BDN70DRAFT_878591 [Pholiota conissans]|uniref:DUF7918 domain-containing protein n=1 Tax=Pholiota conissans TaxID=109636 RepID=A0A9P5Z3J5_9AGAR|nr:hypothetical protein BDN70DRAFT_878591 [Pholiota conissans]